MKRSLRRITMSRNPGQARVTPRSARLAVAILFFMNGTVFASWATRIPTVQAKLTLNTSELGLALLGSAVGALIGMNVSGYLTTRIGSRLVVTIGSVGLYMVLLLLALAPTFPLLVIALVLFGTCNGSMDVGMNTQGVAVEQLYRRSILNSFHAFFSFGGLVGSLVSGIAASYRLDLLSHFLGITLLCLILTISTAHLLLPADTNGKKRGIVFAFPTHTLLALGLIAFCVVLGESTIAGWSAVYLAGTLHAGAGPAAFGYGVFSVVMAVSRGLGDQLTTRFKPVIMVRLGGLTAAIGLTTALVVIWTPLAILGFGLVGAGFSVVFPLALSAAGRSSKQSSGTAIAAVATCGHVGALVGPPIIGFAASALTLRLSLGLVVVLSLFIVVFAHVVSSNEQAGKGCIP
jgi:MFS family permease